MGRIGSNPRAMWASAHPKQTAEISNIYVGGDDPRVRHGERSRSLVAQGPMSSAGPACEDAEAMPTGPDPSAKATMTALDKYHGSKVFERAAFTIGLDDLLSRKLLWEAATASLVDSWKMTIEDVGLLMPVVERRLRLLAPPDEASAAFARLRSFVLSWEE
jgi:hypothetical protein